MHRGWQLWHKWDTSVDQGGSAVEILRSLTDESVLELLATGDPVKRRYECDLLMTEAMNRVRRLRHSIVEAAVASRETAQAVERALALVQATPLAATAGAGSSVTVLGVEDLTRATVVARELQKRWSALEDTALARARYPPS